LSYLDTIKQIERETLTDLQPVKPDWLAAWRDLAGITYGITEDDPRFQLVMVALQDCDAAFAAGDWQGFQQGVAQVYDIVGRSGIS
jgi:hypothetical protein